MNVACNKCGFEVPLAGTVPRGPRLWHDLTCRLRAWLRRFTMSETPKGPGPKPPEHEPMAIEPTGPYPFPVVHEISSMAILEGIWVGGRLRLRIDPREEEAVTLELPPTEIRGFIQFLQQMEKQKP